MAAFDKEAYEVPDYDYQYVLEGEEEDK